MIIRKRYLFPVLAIPVTGLVILMMTLCRQKPPKADLVLTNGVVATMDPVFPEATAIAIKGETILMVGDHKDIQTCIGPYTELIDLKGQFVCPGFHDAHVNMFPRLNDQGGVDLSEFRSMREFYNAMFHPIQKQRLGTWFVGFGWDQNLFPDRTLPDKYYLERWPFNQYPVILIRVCGHVALVNNKAMGIVGINQDTPNPPGGEIVKSEKTGKPTGILTGTAIDLVRQYLPKPDINQFKSILNEFLQEARQFGITSTRIFTDVETCPVFQQFLAEDRLTSRISLLCPLRTDLATAREYRNQYNHPLLAFGGLKGDLDGSLGGYTAGLLHAYDDNPSTQGVLRMSQNDLNLLVMAADEAGFQISLQASGDRAVRMALDAYELSIRLDPKPERRHCIEHVHVVSPADFKRFSELNVVASMQPNTCARQMDWIEQRIGVQRNRYAHAWKRMLRNGAVLAFGSDWPGGPLNPLTGIYTAVTRKDTLGYRQSGRFPQECLSVYDALYAYTVAAAYTDFRENATGCIAPGKWADLVVLDRNLLKILPRDILSTKVVMTITGGRIVYQKSTD